jgi:GNAT superfamily N-acetyltransferase
MDDSLGWPGVMEWTRDGYTVSDDPARVDVDAVHRYLTEESYWAPGVPRDVVARSIENSLPFGLYAPDGSLAGFARAVTDRAVFAYVADVFVLEAHRGRGLGVWLMQAMVEHPELRGLRRWVLYTEDAHGLYERFGFGEARTPERYMELVRDADELYG